MTVHHGSCHCGAIKLVLRETPTDVGDCNCTLCRRIGGLWHHTAPAKVTVHGGGKAYRQGDCTLDTWHCPSCGCTTHWTPVDPEYPRMAVNLRMFDPDLWQGLPRRLIDGASY